MSNITDFVTIKKVTDDMFVVETTLANGWQQIQRCDNDHDARCYVAGIRDGFRMACNAIGDGLHFNGRVEEVGK